MESKLEAHAYAQEVERNARLRNGLKRVSNYANGKCDVLVTKVGLRYGENKERLVETMRENRTMIPKYISYITLRNPISIFLFHWFYWRWLNGTRSTEEMLSTLMVVLDEENNNAAFFLGCLKSLQMNNMMIEMATTAPILNISQKLRSEEDMIQLKQSTEM